jgi:hypothetical protein
MSQPTSASPAPPTLGALYLSELRALLKTSIFASVLVALVLAIAGLPAWGLLTIPAYFLVGLVVALVNLRRARSRLAWEESEADREALRVRIGQLEEATDTLRRHVKDEQARVREWERRYATRVQWAKTNIGNWLVKFRKIRRGPNNIPAEAWEPDQQGFLKTIAGVLQHHLSEELATLLRHAVKDSKTAVMKRPEGDVHTVYLSLDLAPLIARLKEILEDLGENDLSPKFMPPGSS